MIFTVALFIRCEMTQMLNNGEIKQYSYLIDSMPYKYHEKNCAKIYINNFNYMGKCSQYNMKEVGY